MKRQTRAQLEDLIANYRIAAVEREKRLETLYTADRHQNQTISELRAEVIWLRQLTQNLSGAICRRSHS